MANTQSTFTKAPMNYGASTDSTGSLFSTCRKNPEFDLQVYYIIPKLLQRRCIVTRKICCSLATVHDTLCERNDNQLLFVQSDQHRPAHEPASWSGLWIWHEPFLIQLFVSFSTTWTDLICAIHVHTTLLFQNWNCFPWRIAYSNSYHFLWSLIEFVNHRITIFDTHRCCVKTFITDLLHRKQLLTRSQRTTKNRKGKKEVLHFRSERFPSHSTEI